MASVHRIEFMKKTSMKKELFSPLSDLEYKLYEHIWEAWKAFFKEHAPEKKDEKSARRRAMERFVKAVCADANGQNGEAGQDGAQVLPPVETVVYLTLHLEDIRSIVPELLEALYAPEFAIEHEAALACFITLRQQPETAAQPAHAAPAPSKKTRTVSYCSSSCKSSCRRKCGSYAKRMKKSLKRRS